jgi:hypothetical protein
MRTQLWVNHAKIITDPADPIIGPPSAELINPVMNRNGGWHKPEPRTAFWTSTFDDPHNWVNWCHMEEWEPPEGAHSFWLLDVDPDAKVYEIGDFCDLQILIEHFPHRGVPSHFAREAQIDFEAAARIYDGIHLTGGGELATRNTEPGLYGWDCESTLWFRWKFNSVRQVARHTVETEYLV